MGAVPTLELHRTLGILLEGPSLPHCSALVTMAKSLPLDLSALQVCVLLMLDTESKVNTGGG